MPRPLLPASTLRWTSWLGAIFGGVALAPWILSAGGAWKPRRVEGN